MTHTEIIATKLFGWYPQSQSNNFVGGKTKAYSNGFTNVWIGAADGKPHRSATSKADLWPDFTEPQLKYYWIAQMEQRIAERGLLLKYVHHLHNACIDSPMKEWESIPVFIMLRATPEQRIEAAVNVLEGVE